MTPQIAETLRPRDRAELRGSKELTGINALAELAEHRGNVVEPTRVISVADELERGRLRAGDAQHASGRVHTPDPAPRMRNAAPDPR
jgi:hypothetical protein